MRKAASNRLALGLGLLILTACQSADRSPLGATAPPEAQHDQGTARTAADPIPVPGGPAPVPVPGAPGSGPGPGAPGSGPAPGAPAPAPVPGTPTKGPAPGGPTPAPSATPTPGATPTPTPAPTPTPLPPGVTVTFISTDVPVTAAPSGGLRWRIASVIPVSGITGPVLNIMVALQATVPDDSLIHDIRVSKSLPFGQSSASVLYSDTFATSRLSGADLGTSCTPFGGATTFDDRAATEPLEAGAAPYAGVFDSQPGASTLPQMAAVLRTPDYSNGDWLLEILVEAGANATLECWSLKIEYQP